MNTLEMPEQMTTFASPFNEALVKAINGTLREDYEAFSKDYTDNFWTAYIAWNERFGQDEGAIVRVSDTNLTKLLTLMPLIDNSIHDQITSPQFSIDFSKDNNQEFLTKTIDNMNKDLFVWLGHHITDHAESTTFIAGPYLYVNHHHGNDTTVFAWMDIVSLSLLKD